MKNHSLLIKLVCCALVVCCAFGLMPSPLYAQGRSLTAKQLDAIVKPSLAQCSPQSARLKSGQLTSGRIDPASIIPTRNAREFPKDRIAKTLHGMWRGQVFGDYNKDLRVDYFWIIDTKRNEGLIIAQRTGNESMAGLRPVANAPKITYLMCANEGYIPSSEGGSQIHEFTKVSDSIEDAPQILQKATGLKLQTERPTLSELWQEIVALGYFKSLPAVAFAGALFKPIQLDLVASEIGPAQVSMKWDGEYYGGGATSLKFPPPGVPIKGVEYTQFVGTTATSGDFLVASPGNGKLYKVESFQAEDYSYDLAFDSVTVGPLEY
ncbi:MAG: hypothetical protein WCF57_06940 [Pyrinomonadaceae bacterium]